MVDARLETEWRESLLFDALSDTAWRVFTGALMWSARNGTDGFIPARYCRQLHPDGEQPDAEIELRDAGLWETHTDTRHGDGWQFIDWAGDLGQSTAAEIEAYKANARERSRRYRESARQKAQAKAEKAQAKRLTSDVTRDATSDVRAHVGQAEAEAEAEATALNTERSSDNSIQGQSDELVTQWPTRKPGEPDEWGEAF